MQVFQGIILAIAYRGCISHLIYASTLFGFGSCVVFCTLGLGLGEHFASFHFVSSLRVLWKEKCRFSFQLRLREGYLLFHEMS